MVIIQKKEIMNLKERGITVGDLLLLLIVIFSAIIITKTFNQDRKSSYINENKQKIYTYKNQSTYHLS